MSLLLAAEAETLFEAMFSFFRGELGDVYGVDIHGVRILGRGRRSWGTVRVGTFWAVLVRSTACSH